MQHEYVEELLFIFGSTKANLAFAPHAIEALITETAESIQRELGGSLLKHDRVDLNLIHLVLAAKVVDKIRNSQKICIIYMWLIRMRESLERRCNNKAFTYPVLREDHSRRDPG